MPGMRKDSRTGGAGIAWPAVEFTPSARRRRIPAGLPGQGRTGKGMAGETKAGRGEQADRGKTEHEGGPQGMTTAVGASKTREE